MGDVVREALDVQTPGVDQAYHRGHAKGFTLAEKMYRVDYRCSVCGGTLTIAEKEDKEAAARLMREEGWAHEDCINDG